MSIHDETTTNSDEASDLISKSERKRQMAQLQDIGATLVNLDEDKLDKLEVSDTLKNALLDAKRIKKREALRRQYQYIGKLMRKEKESTLANIDSFVEQRDQQKNRANGLFHQTETWRDAILSDPSNAIDAFLKQFTLADRQRLRQLVRQHHQEIEKGKPTAAKRKLFRYLQTFINE